jgi:hypothetical protein
VEAVHGKRFEHEPWLQRYFDERYWYAPDDAYDAGRLTPIEARNLALIDSLGHGSDASAVHACDMGLFEQRLITPEDLQGAGFMLLRILRNEVYARHGLTFGEQGLQMHFGFTSWYVQRPGQPVVLSAIEQRNVATISAHERTLRDSLRTRPLDPALLEGLYAEDARRLRLEIYARHGRVFRRRWEQDFVASRPGYRPDPGYSEAMLADVERANIAAIVAYEKTAASVMDAVEG